jgi:hypothetical protein
MKKFNSFSLTLMMNLYSKPMIILIITNLSNPTASLEKLLVIILIEK